MIDVFEERRISFAELGKLFEMSSAEDLNISKYNYDAYKKQK